MTSSPPTRGDGNDAGNPLDWLITAFTRRAIDADELRARLAPRLEQRMPVPAVAATLSQLAAGMRAPVTVAARTTGEDGVDVVTLADAGGGRLQLLASSDHGRFTSLRVQPDREPPAPASGSVAELVAQLAGCTDGPASIDVAALGPGGSRTLASHQPDRVLAVGSAFKLYVLAAVADAVARQTAGWDEPLDGAVTVRQAATGMIAMSDNDLTDRLIERVGREAVEGALRRASMTDPARNLPLIGMAEMVALKRSTAPEPTWQRPIAIDTLEWFASAADLSRCMASLHARPEAVRDELDRVLGANPGIEVDADWVRLWFKGGGEPGVLAVAWLAELPGDRVFTISAALNSVNGNIDVERALSAAGGLLAGLAAPA